MDFSLRETLKEKVAALDEEGVLSLVRQSLESGTDPMEIIAACEEGMRVVGEQYERGSSTSPALSWRVRFSARCWN